MLQVVFFTKPEKVYSVQNADQAFHLRMRDVRKQPLFFVEL